MQKVSQNWQSWLSPNLRKQRAVRKKEATHRSVVFTQKRLCVASFFHRANARQRGNTKFFRAAALRTRKKRPIEALCLHKSSCVWLLFFIGRMPDSEEKRSFFELPHCGLERSDQETFFLQPPPRGAEESSLTSAKITTHISTI